MSTYLEIQISEFVHISTRPSWTRKVRRLIFDLPGDMLSTGGTGGRTICHRTIWHRAIWHRTIWHQDSNNGQFQKRAHFRSNIREVFTVLHQRCAKTIDIVNVRYEFELNIFACCHEMTQDSLIIKIKD